MKPLPLPIRIAAGLVATATDKAKDLPKTVTGLPVTMVSQALQLSMRVQQNLTELAIRGDSALSMLRPVEETPAWATFDEDTASSYEATTPRRTWSAWDAVEDDEPADDSDEADDTGFDTGTDVGAGEYGDDELAAEDDDPWELEEQAITAAQATGIPTSDLAADGDLDDDPAIDDPATATPSTTAATGTAGTPTDPAGSPTAFPDYPDLSIAQLRARLRTFTEDQLAELLTYERAHGDRDEFATMLSRRIETVRNRT